MTDSEIPRTDHLKLFLKLAVVCSTVLLVDCSADDPQRYIDEGKVLFDKGELESARLQFQNALQLDPKLADAYFRLALLDEKKQNWAGMLNNLMEAISINPKHFEGQLKFGQIYLVGGQLDKAAEYATTALQLNAENPTAILLLASIQFRRNQHREAMQGVEQVLAKQPFLPEALGLQANILAADEQIDTAIAILQPAIEHNPHHTDLRLLRIRLEIEGQHFEAALRHYRDLIAEHPEDMDLHASLADLLSEIGRRDEAENTLRMAVERFPAEIALKLKLVDLLEQHHAEQVEKTLQAFIALAPEASQLKTRLADYYLKNKRLTDAENQLIEIADFDSKGMDGLAAMIKLAEIALLQNKIEKVESLAEQVLRLDSSNGEALLLRAGMRLNKRDADGAIADLRIVLRDRPNSEKALMLLAQANLLKGETEVAESQWRKVLEINPDNTAAIMALTNELLKQGDYTRAEDLSIKASIANPSDPAPVEMLIRLKAARKDWQGAQNAVRQLEGNPQNALSAKYWEGFLAAQQGRSAEAIKAYQDVLTLQPNHAQALLALSQFYEASGRRDDLIAYLKKFSSKNPRVTQAQLLLATAFGADKNWPAAEDALRNASENTPDDIDLKLRWVNVIEKQSDTRTESTLKAWIQADPNQMRLKFRLASYYADRQHYADAVLVLQEIVGFDADSREGLAAKLKLAELAWLQKDSKMADMLLAEVIAKQPLKNEALLLRASMRMAQMDATAAIIDLRQVLERQPAFEPALRMLAEAYQGSPNQTELIAFLKSLLQSDPHADAVYPLLATAYAVDKKWLEAEKLLRDKLKRDPKDVQAHVLLARVLAGQGKDVEAELIYRNGLAAVGNNRQLMGERAKFYIVKRDFDKAIAAYEEIVTLFPKDDEAANNLANLLVSHRADNKASAIRAIALVERFQDTANASVRDTYGWVHLKAGDVQTALPALQNASAIAPKDPSIHYHLAEAYRHAGNTQIAISELEKSLTLADEGQGAFYEKETVQNLLKQLRNGD